MSLISPFAKYNCRQDVLNHIKNLEEMKIFYGNLGAMEKWSKARAQMIRDLKKKLEDFPE